MRPGIRSGSRLVRPGAILVRGSTQLPARPLVEAASRLEVWSEKGTVRGTLAPVLTIRRDDPRHARLRFGDRRQPSRRRDHGLGKSIAILYVGDWDPSGMHMSEVDYRSGLLSMEVSSKSARGAEQGRRRKMALCHRLMRAQKAKDPRYKWFVRKYGHRRWELDALSPGGTAREGSELHTRQH